jgi:hypothetical protein
VNSVERIKNRLRNLKQNVNLSDEEIGKLAQEQLEKTEILGSLTFVLPEEMDFATTLLEKYLAESSIESAAEKDTLRQLIDLEVLLERIKKLLNTEYSKANPAIPVQLLSQVTEINNQIIQVKENLGLTKSEDVNFINTWELLKKKALKYYEEHAGCNIVKCPYCQQLFHLLIDRTDYKEIKSTWFKNSILYNKKLFDLYHNKIITKENVAEVLGVSLMYVELIYDQLYLKELEQNDKQD